MSAQLTYKVSVVNYTNSIPFVHGLKGLAQTGLIALSEDIPSVCADKLISGQVDIGLVPVAMLPRMQQHFVIPGYCIGAEGAVNSVMLFSEVPLSEIETIALDYQSRTSVMLLKLLAKDFWKIAPRFELAEPGFEKQVGGKKAALVIGDRSFPLLGKHAHTFDLAEEWMKHTGKPFVFACWASRTELPVTFIEQFNRALKTGLDAREELCRNRDDADFVHTYLTKFISYPLTDSKVNAMHHFLARITDLT